MTDIHRVTSRNNERLVRFRKARDGKLEGEIFIEGLRLAEESLRSELRISECAFTPQLAATERGSRLLERLQLQKVHLVEVSDSLFKTISDTATAQGIAMTAERPQTSFDSFVKTVPDRGIRLFLYLHETNDPSNLGAVLRTAEAAGVTGVAISKGSADPFSPKALRGGMGANLRLAIWTGMDADGCVRWARSMGLRVAAADIKGTKAYTEFDWSSPALLMLGSEAHGLADAALHEADDVINIPMKNNVESLNLAVSAGIVLFEAVRQTS